MSPQGGLLQRRRVLAAIVVTTTITVPAVAQPAQDCGGRGCASFNQIWVPAAQIHEIKNQFVAAVRQFAGAMAGSYGDERSQILSSIASLDRARTQWDAAIKVYEETLSAFAETADIHVGLGTVYLDRARIDDALRELGQAGRLDPGRADVHSLSALAYGLAGRPEDAARSLLKASALDGGNPITLYSLAQQLIKSGQREQAAATLRTFHDSARGKPADASATSGTTAPFERVSLLRQVAGVAPIFPLHRYRQGFTLLLDGHYEEAIGELKRAADSDPLAETTGAADPVVLASAALRQGRLAVALRTLEDTASTAPDRSEAHRLLGVAYWADGQYNRSIAQLNTATRLASDDERSRLALADVLIEAGRAAEAEQSLKETVQVIPDSGAAHYRLGQIYQTRSLPPQAVLAFETAATFTPLVGLDRLDETIGGLYVNQANFERAVDAYVHRVEINPNSADAHHKLGEIYFLQGRDDEALAEFAAALMIDAKHSDALSAACQAYLRMGRYTDAVDSGRRALALNVRTNEVHYALATSLMRLGQADEGRKELETFQKMRAEAMANTQHQSELKFTLLSAAASLAQGEYVAAAGLFRTALAADPDNVDGQRDLGISLMKAGQQDAAIQPLARAAQLEDRADLHQLLADAYKAVGRVEDSQAQALLAERATERGKQERLRKITAGR